MIIYSRPHGYSKNKKYIVGRGFVDSISSIFNSIRSAATPILRDVGSYIATNKDLVAKPLLGALGTLAATGITTGANSLLNHIKNKNKLTPAIDSIDTKGLEIINNILTMPDNPEKIPTSNLIGSGLKKNKKNRKKKGSGIKTF